MLEDAIKLEEHFIDERLRSAKLVEPVAFGQV
jgi:hypothetical protein